MLFCLPVLFSVENGHASVQHVSGQVLNSRMTDICVFCLKPPNFCKVKSAVFKCSC